MNTAQQTRLAQSGERQTFNLVVEGSSPSSGAKVCVYFSKTRKNVFIQQIISFIRNQMKTVDLLD